MRELEDRKYPFAWDYKRIIFIFLISFLFQIIRVILKVGNSSILKYEDILWYMGIVFIVMGILDTSIEKRMDLGLFYAKGGMSFNASFLCAVGVDLAADGFLQTFFWALGTAAIVGVECYIIDYMRSKKKQRYIGKTGLAVTDINYKGKGKFQDKILKVRVTHDKIGQGAMIKITDIDGFNIIVETKGYRVL